jgi:transcriptional regulator with XRE-family HTH domain
MTPDEFRARRKALRLSQTALAEALGVTQHTVSRWEQGKMAITAPRSVWLDLEMKRVERERTPRRRAPRRPRAAQEGGDE